MSECADQAEKVSSTGLQESSEWPKVESILNG